MFRPEAGEGEPYPPVGGLSWSCRSELEVDGVPYPPAAGIFRSCLSVVIIAGVDIDSSPSALGSGGVFLFTFGTADRGG